MFLPLWQSASLLWPLQKCKNGASTWAHPSHVKTLPFLHVQPGQKKMQVASVTSIILVHDTEDSTLITVIVIFLFTWFSLVIVARSSCSLLFSRIVISFSLLSPASSSWDASSCLLRLFNSLSRLFNAPWSWLKEFKILVHKNKNFISYVGFLS